MGLAQRHKTATRVMFEPVAPSVSSQALQHCAVILTFHQNKIYRTPEIGLSIYDNQHLGTIQTRPSQPVCMAGKAGVLREKNTTSCYLFLFYFIINFLLLDNSIAYVYSHSARICSHLTP